ncbi:MAG: lipopolysaccharide heptosyltransferase II [Candidatus Aminicenantes bacterium]|nr:lipopolysaccharide heptosyltransferase II [Candidatus Aminicenantes bacterium]
MKIVVRMPNWVGDAVMALPALESLRRNDPRSEIWTAGPAWLKDLLAGTGASGFVPLGPSGSLGEMFRQASALKALRFEAGLLLTNSFASAFLFRLAGIPQRWGYRRDGRGFLLTKGISRPDGGRSGHMVRYYLDLIEGLGLETWPPDIRLGLRPEDRTRAEEILRTAGLDSARPLIILHPGAAYGPAKRWPAERFAALGRRFIDVRGAEIILTGSAEDGPVAEEIAARLGRPEANLAGRTTLGELLGAVSRAAVFVTNDTGPMHLANALRVPVVAVFGPTDPAVTAPFHPPSAVVKKSAVCWPCLYRECPYDHRCLTAVSVEDVFAAAAEFLP